jgi:nicotinate-nucleotide adenylyltransferase
MSQAVSKGRRVAFFGGSFDPPHLGHLAVARAARVALGLDTVLFAPVGAQPLKPVGATAGFDDRVAMTRLAIAGERGFVISLADAPKTSGAPNYTVETLEKLQRELGPDCALFCLMGADSFAGLRLWHRAAEIPFVAHLIVASRPGDGQGERMDDLQSLLPAGLTMEPAAATELPESDVEVRCYSLLGENERSAGQRAPFYLLPGLDVAISASQIRELANGQVGADAGSLAGHELLPDAVAEYVRAYGLYR